MGTQLTRKIIAIPIFHLWLIFPVLATSLQHNGHSGVVRHYTFNVRMKNVTRLCQRKPLITVNGRFPGPSIAVHEGDQVLVSVNNHVNHNVTIHWHGVRQLRSGWSDGPAYITQCPIQKGMSYLYNFRISGQRGTLWWHAHVSWLRATVYGAFLIYPRAGVPYPFPKPHKELPPLLVGQWWNADTEAIIKQALLNGGGPNVSDAYTFNGLPGPLYAYSKPNNTSCSSPSRISKQTFVMDVVAGKTYLLRIINAALNQELFFAIANHTLTVVEVDASYTKPFQTQTLHIAPGQTTNVLFTAHSCPSKQLFLMAARPFATGSGTFDNSTVAGVLRYKNAFHPRQENAALKSFLLSRNTTLQKLLPPLPALNDTSFAANFSKSLRSLGSHKYPAKVPMQVDRKFFFTVGLGLDPCGKGMNKTKRCQGPNGTRFSASINNISMITPSKSLLQSYFGGHTNGVFSTAFPDNPPFAFDFTGTPPNNTRPARGTMVKVVEFNTSVEVVLQDTSIGGTESHPLHFHGYNFFVVAQGVGNFNASLLRRPNGNVTFINMVDPVERNTVPVPKGGWVAVRFWADNPGVWLMHCHLDIHLSWGLSMAWLVKNGVGPLQSLAPPPRDLPPC